MSGTDDELARDRQGALLLLRLNRPEARNSRTTGLVDVLGTAVLEAPLLPSPMVPGHLHPSDPNDPDPNDPDPNDPDREG